MADTADIRLKEGNQQLRQQVAELEDELRTTRLRLEDLDQLYHTAPIGLGLVDTQMRFVRINAKLAAINGVPIKDHIGATLREILPDLADTIEPLHQRVIDSGEPVMDMEVEGVTQAHLNGVGNYLVSYFPVQDRGGRVVGVSTTVQDITALKHAQKDLFEQSELLRQIISNVPHSIFWKDRQSIYLGCNERTAIDLGLKSPNKIAGMTDYDTSVTRKQAEAFRAYDARVMDRGQAELNIEEHQRRADGTEAVLLTSKVPLRDASGNVNGVLGIYSDITERKQAEQKLHESEARLRVLVDHAPEAIVLFDADTGKFADANENAEQLFGLDRESLLAVGPMEMTPATQRDGQDSKKFGQKMINEALAGGAPVFEWVHKSTTGKEILCEIRLVTLPYAGRNLIRGSITDISERLAAQNALEQAHNELEQRVASRTAQLAESEERWRSLIQTAPDIILVVDLDGTIRYINRVHQDFDVDDVIGTSAYDYVQSEHQAAMKVCYESVLSTGEVHEFESSVNNSDGSVTWYSSRVGPFYERGKTTGVTSIATDTTEAKKAEEKLKAEDQLLRQMLDLQEKERRMVAYDIHDGFVQDIVGAHMRIEGIRAASDLESISKSLDAVAGLLQKGIAEGRRMIRDLRPMVLDEAGVVEAIHHLIADEKKHETLVVAFDHRVQFDRLEPTLEGAIFRIVQESLTNVKRYAKTDHATVSLKQSDGMLQIEISDDGVGFDPDKVSVERFGLRGIRERSRLFGGAATIESSPGAGTVIRAILPIDTTRDSAATGPTGDSTSP